MCFLKTLEDKMCEIFFVVEYFGKNNEYLKKPFLIRRKWNTSASVSVDKKLSGLQSSTLVYSYYEFTP